MEKGNGKVLVKSLHTPITYMNVVTVITFACSFCLVVMRIIATSLSFGKDWEDKYKFPSSTCD